MSAFQSIVENLLLGTNASRAVLQLVGPSGELSTEAEAVSHGMRQIRHDGVDGELREDATLRQLARDGQIVAQDDLAAAAPPAARVLVERFGAQARILVPLMREGRLVGVLSVHHSQGPRGWSQQDIDAAKAAQAAALSVLEAQNRRALAMTKDDLRDAALQAVLDSVRQGLRVQRCTLRQNVSALYAFPVTHESRAEGVRSLLGDFTIVQSGQPVIEKMIAERVQVVQSDTRNASADPLFHVMLKHYGDMRAQIVTPLFREDSLAAVLSIHSLKELRTWTPEEIQLARSAARILGLIVGATLA